jgi:transcriptional repressor NrdR
MLQESPDKELPTSKVGAYVMQRLKELDKVAYVRFASVYRQFEDVTDFLDELKTLMELKKTEESSEREKDGARTAEARQRTGEEG